MHHAGLGFGLVVAGMIGCAHPTPAASPPTTSTTSATTPSSDGVLGPGISGDTERGLTTGPDGTPYNGNVDPGSPASNREKRATPDDVRNAPLAK